MAEEPTTKELLEAIVDLKDGMVEGFGAVHRRFDVVEQRLLDHDRRFDTIDRRLGRIETRVEDL